MLDLSFTEFHTSWCNLYFTFVSNNLHISNINIINSKLEIIFNAKWIITGNYIPKKKSNIFHIEIYKFNIFKPMFFIDGFNFFAFPLYIENKPYQCRYKQLFKVNWIMSLMTKHFVFEILDSRILPLWRFECFALSFEVLSSTLKMQRYQVLCLKRAAKNLSSSQGISTNHPK